MVGIFGNDFGKGRYPVLKLAREEGDLTALRFAEGQRVFFDYVFDLLVNLREGNLF